MGSRVFEPLRLLDETTIQGNTTIFNQTQLLNINQVNEEFIGSVEGQEKSQTGIDNQIVEVVANEVRLTSYESNDFNEQISVSIVVPSKQNESVMVPETDKLK